MAAQAVADEGVSKGQHLWRCPKCGGTDLKKHSLIHQEYRATSTSKTNAAGIGIGTAGIGVGIGSARSTGMTVADLARRAAPPEKSQLVQSEGSGGGLLLTLMAASVCAFLAYRVGGWLGGALAFIIVFIAGAIMSGAKGSPALESKYRAALDRWNRLYICMRCGESVEITSTGPILAAADVDPELDYLLRQNQRIQAVKRVVDTTGVGPAEASQRVKERARELGL